MNDFEYFLMAVIAVGAPIMIVVGWAMRSVHANESEVRLLRQIAKLHERLSSRAVVNAKIVAQLDEPPKEPSFLRNRTRRPFTIPREIQ
jgi:hypothetical protein